MQTALTNQFDPSPLASQSMLTSTLKLKCEGITSPMNNWTSIHKLLMLSELCDDFLRTKKIGFGVFGNHPTVHSGGVTMGSVCGCDYLRK